MHLLDLFFQCVSFQVINAYVRHGYMSVVLSFQVINACIRHGYMVVLLATSLFCFIC